MDVKELRIGNLVKDDECIIVAVEALSGDNALVNGYGENEVLFSKKGYPNVLFESEIHPIELTEELLLKCGFKEVKNKINIFVNGRLKYWIGNNGGLAYLKNEDSDESYFIPNHGIKYIHQLQNLYFNLTGEELDVSRIIDTND